MNHKRKRPKNRRAGCLMCKPYKANGSSLHSRQRHSVNKKLDNIDQQLQYVRGICYG